MSTRMAKKQEFIERLINESFGRVRNAVDNAETCKTDYGVNSLKWMSAVDELLIVSRIEATTMTELYRTLNTMNQ